MRRVLVAVLVLATVATATAPGTGASARPQVVTLYPNPVADGDAGEFAIVRFPEGTDLSAFALTDGETRIELSNRTVSGRVAFTDDPRRVRNLTDARVLAVDLPELANGGDELRLLAGNATVSELAYDDSSEGELLTREGWRHLAATDLPVVAAGEGSAQVFVLPDAPGPPVESIRSASERVLLAGYTFGSRRVMRSLLAAERRGVAVEVLVDGAPVGGLPRRTARLLDRLVAAGVTVRVVGGPYAPYEFHHAKYAVVDDRAVVLTENWVPAGVGGHSSRGWGVALDDADAARALTATFRADSRGISAVPWTEFRKGEQFSAGGAANDTFPRRFAPRSVRYRNASVLVAPDNAESAVVARLDAADDSIRVVQAGVGGLSQPFVRACIRAGRRGVTVRILLSGAWYSYEENRRIAGRLNDIAAREDLPLSARVSDPRGRFEKIHAKGAIVDGETVILGSLNWNNHSARQNREVAVAIESAAAADYFGRVFRADWRGSAWRLPVGVGIAVLVGATVAVLSARRMEFA